MFASVTLLLTVLAAQFGPAGVTTTDFGREDAAVAVAVQLDGRLGAVRYLPDGTLDPSFGGGDGSADLEKIGYDCRSADAVARQADGKLVLVGTIGCGGATASWVSPQPRRHDRSHVWAGRAAARRSSEVGGTSSDFALARVDL